MGSALSGEPQPLATRFRSPGLIYDIDIGEFVQFAVGFEQSLARVKAGETPRVGWYPHDSFGTLLLVDQLLKGPERFLRRLVGREPLVDIGCGDGDLSFTFGSLGAEVHAVDNPATNFNAMRGVKTLKRALRSPVRVSSLDLDSRFQLPVRQCGLALFLGILYHLKNPYGALEALARSTRYCLLSTAIARRAPDNTSAEGLPVAFLVDRDGLRGDDTNYWIFTEAGLRVLFDRTGWEVREWMVTREPDSTLWACQCDERVFCLLESRVASKHDLPQLYEGWHRLENNAWRWTARTFSIIATSPSLLELNCTVLHPLQPPIGLQSQHGQFRFDSLGQYDISIPVQAGVNRFELDRWIAPDENDGRERGLLVQNAALRPLRF